MPPTLFSGNGFEHFGTRRTVPEGDTVWLAAQRLHAALAGHRLLSADLRVPRWATADLSGRDVLEVVPRGKHLLFRLSSPEYAGQHAAPVPHRQDALTLHTHFRMDGSWHLYRTGTAWTGGPHWQIRAVLQTQEWSAVGYRLPIVDLLATAAEDTVVGHLGPDLLGPDWDRAEVIRRLMGSPQRQIGDALLDQRNLAGIGNLYKAETLFLRGVWPWTEVAQVADIAAVLDTSQRLLTSNRARPEQSTTGDLRRGHQHWVFERAGRPCRRCGTSVVREMQGSAPQQRITYWCPRCQPRPPPASQPPP